jgi:hypothetical protein
VKLPSTLDARSRVLVIEKLAFMCGLLLDELNRLSVVSAASLFFSTLSTRVLFAENESFDTGAILSDPPPVS